jgi:hypothetical protein
MLAVATQAYSMAWIVDVVSDNILGGCLHFKQVASRTPSGVDGPFDPSKGTKKIVKTLVAS